MCKKVVESSRPKGKTIQRLYQWVLFNIIIGNGDAHLKNMNFYQVDEGSVLPHMNPPSFIMKILNDFII
ncbi:HipA domain-containing protein [Colwelliaceae bacterium 6441]